MKFVQSSKKRQPVILIGLLVPDDVEYILRLLDAEKGRATNQLHQFAMQSDQRRQRVCMENFKKASGLFDMLRDRLENYMNNEQREFDSII